ncbi:MAG: DNA-processing protein DprA, partial [Ruminococcus sp.]|nr:DNA-processing protein DprA [Ruminococcus sp.]
MERTDMKNNHTEEYSTGQIRCIEKSDPEYPQIMKQYSSMPAKLYVKGRLPDPKRRTVAVIGARMCSPYGRMQAFRYAKALSVAGVQIISGMALGIDSEGHKGALEGKMPTFAVLGSGVDVCYPKSNRKLYERILWENGGIISALSDAVLVVEAKENSGSLITAGFALEQGKMVYAIPGAVTDELSRGCHKLIYDGAGIAYCPEIMLEELGISMEKVTQNGEKNNLGLARD